MHKENDEPDLAYCIKIENTGALMVTDSRVVLLIQR